MSSDGGAHLPGLERNAVVAASAGTGKTHLITNIYLAHVLGLGASGREVPPERIVATTFSRAAAREIRERLEQRLSNIASSEPTSHAESLDPRLAELASARGLDARTLAFRAARALEQLPRTLIDTLHGLAARVLRNHALELGLAQSFAVLDEQQALEDATSTIEDLFARALAEGGTRAGAVIALLDAAGGLEACTFQLQGFLALLDEEGLDAHELALRDHALEARTLAELFDGAAGAVLSSRTHPLREAALALRAALDAPSDPRRLTGALETLLRDRRPQLERYEHGRALGDVLDALLQPSKPRQERIQKTALFLSSAPLLQESERAMRGLIDELQRELRRRRKARGVFGFGDLLRLARDALRDDPDLAARAAAAFELLLVDEFQDTSRVQRDLLFLLRERPERSLRRRSGTLPRAHDLHARGLVVVGDRKQSIYAFRGADVSVYAHLAAELAGDTAVRALDLHGVEATQAPVAELVPLAENFRSKPAILRFVNRVCEADFNAAPRYAFEIRYTESEALVARAGRFADDGVVTLVSDDGSVDAGAEALLGSARGQLRTALVAAGYCALARSEGRAFGELALLARRRSSLPLLELALDRLRIPFVVAGRALYATPEVRDLAALMRWTLDPYDRHALAVVARGPLGGLSDRALAELSEPGRGLLPAARWATHTISDASDARLAHELRERLLELAEVGPRLSPRDMLAFCSARFELEAVLSRLPRGRVRFGNVDRLLEIAARRGGSLPQFSRWLERQIAIDADETEAATFSDEDDAVRLLTIHASKGLSFPVSILVDVGGSELPRPTLFSILRAEAQAPTFVVRHKGLSGATPTPLNARANADAALRCTAERQRLSYVALTRARDELVVVMPAPDGVRRGSLGETLLRVHSELEKLPGFRTLEARNLLASVPSASESTEVEASIPSRPRVAPYEVGAIGVTALADYVLCARRFQLLHVLGIQEIGTARGIERGSEGDAAARVLGSAAHQVLQHFPLERLGRAVSEAEIERALEDAGLSAKSPEASETSRGIRGFLASQYARELRERARRVHREIELGVRLEHVRQPAAGKRQLELFEEVSASAQAGLLRATLDLVVERDDGSIDIIDYKRSRGAGSSRYKTQLFAYRLAAEQRWPGARIRTGLVHLLADSQEPAWVEPEPVDFARALESLALCRYADDFPGIPEKHCVAFRCGFVGACHARPERRSKDASALPKR